jgi:tetratricopeptide (TPR) repeat protein
MDPLNVRGLQAEMFALYLTKEVEAALLVGKQALAINPNDTELMGEYGYRLALSGKWDEGCSLVKEARARNPGPLAYYETALALCAYFRRDYPQAAMWIKKAMVPSNATYHAIAAAIFGEGGYEADARRERAWLEENAPDLIKNARQEVAMRIIRPQDVDFFLASLRKAGLAVAD